MKEVKFYCDMCGKEIKQDPHSTYIYVTSRSGRHGIVKHNLKIVDRNTGMLLEFCEDCKGTLALLFGEKPNEANETDGTNEID